MQPHQSSSRAELDYAFVAQWATVTGEGTLTAVGASFLRVRTDVGVTLPFTVAGRVRLVHRDSAELGIRIQQSDGNSADFVMPAKPSPLSKYGDDRRHILFAFNTSMPVSCHGMVSVDVLVDGEVTRKLQFEILDPADPRESED